MPFSKMPKSVKSGVAKKHKKHGGKRWMGAYESARKQGHSKETAAKIAYGALNRESLSLLRIYDSLLEAYPVNQMVGGAGKKILYKDIVPELESLGDWKRDIPELAKHLASDGEITEGDFIRLTKPWQNAMVNHGHFPQDIENQLKGVILKANKRAEARAKNPHQDFNPFAEPQKSSGQPADSENSKYDESQVRQVATDFLKKIWIDQGADSMHAERQAQYAISHGGDAIEALFDFIQQKGHSPSKKDWEDIIHSI